MVGVGEHDITMDGEIVGAIITILGIHGVIIQITDTVTIVLVITHTITTDTGIMGTIITTTIVSTTTVITTDQEIPLALQMDAYRVQAGQHLENDLQAKLLKKIIL